MSNTFFQYEILHNSRSMVISGNNDYIIAKQKAFKDAQYYLTECNYHPITININELCNTCSNTGTIKQYQKRNKFIYKTLRCPDCKGILPTFTEEFKVD